jgi:hypothetical protein
LADAIAAQLNSYTGDENVRAIIVDVDGRRRFERYFSSSADQSRSSASVTKSVMSTLVGIAIAEGRLSLDEQLSRMLPRYAPEMKPSVAKVTLRQLLTMTAGFPDTFDAVGEDELYASANWTRFILKHQDSTPGVEFHYSDYGAHLLSPILVQATGQSVLAYARAKLFDPIGIPTTPGIEPPSDTAHTPEYQQAGFAWPVDPQGFNVGAGGSSYGHATWPRSVSSSSKPDSGMACRSCRQPGCDRPPPPRLARPSRCRAAAPSTRRTTDTSGGWRPRTVSRPFTRSGSVDSGSRSCRSGIWS